MHTHREREPRLRYMADRMPPLVNPARVLLRKSSYFRVWESLSPNCGFFLLWDATKASRTTFIPMLITELLKCLLNIHLHSPKKVAPNAPQLTPVEIANCLIGALVRIAALAPAIAPTVPTKTLHVYTSAILSWELSLPEANVPVTTVSTEPFSLSDIVCAGAATKKSYCPCQPH